MGKRIPFSIFLFLSFVLVQLQAVDIAVVTMTIGESYQNLVSAATENKQLYCERHGYDFINLTENLDTSRPTAWNKILIMQEVLKNKNYKWVFWIDGDAIFMNFGITLEELIDENYNFIVGSDLAGCNTGNFFLKNNEWSENFLSLLYSHTEFTHHRYWEQAAVMRELQHNPDVQKNTKILAPRVINSYLCSLHGEKEVYKRGDFILHFATISGERLCDLLNRYTHLTVYDPSLFNLDNFLDMHGIGLNPQNHSSVNEGLIRESQKQQFVENLNANNTRFKDIAVIGFHAGHSTQIFFETCMGIQIDACDQNLNSFTSIGVDFMKRKYRSHFNFFEGDATALESKYDLIFINGDKSFANRFKDIIECQVLAKERAVLWINNCTRNVEKAVNRAVEEGVICIDQYLKTQDAFGEVKWIIAHYI